ncbi:hypothetical protein K4K58_002105 [Colletotrichum sp. SAR11_239]|nr:hypothetical protein K4K58_002105 [Colletotrichum sp. SAR11_239]
MEKDKPHGGSNDPSTVPIPDGFREVKLGIEIGEGKGHIKNPRNYPKAIDHRGGATLFTAPLADASKVFQYIVDKADGGRISGFVWTHEEERVTAAAPAGSSRTGKAKRSGPSRQRGHAEKGTPGSSSQRAQQSPSHYMPYDQGYGMGPLMSMYDYPGLHQHYRYPQVTGYDQYDMDWMPWQQHWLPSDIRHRHGPGAFEPPYAPPRDVHPVEDDDAVEEAQPAENSKPAGDASAARDANSTKDSEPVKNSEPSKDPAPANDVPAATHSDKDAPPTSSATSAPRGKPLSASATPWTQVPRKDGKEPEAPAPPASAPRPMVAAKLDTSVRALHPYKEPQLSRNNKDKTCANCEHEGHVLLDCVEAGNEGYIDGCPWCNDASHIIDDCEAFEAECKTNGHEWTLQVLFHMLWARRVNKPPLATHKSWWLQGKNASSSKVRGGQSASKNSSLGKQWALWSQLGAPWTATFSKEGCQQVDHYPYEEEATFDYHSLVKDNATLDQSGSIFLAQDLEFERLGGGARKARVKCMDVGDIEIDPRAFGSHVMSARDAKNWAVRKSQAANE